MKTIKQLDNQRKRLEVIKRFGFSKMDRCNLKSDFKGFETNKKRLGALILKQRKRAEILNKKEDEIIISLKPEKQTLENIDLPDIDINSVSKTLKVLSSSNNFIKFDSGVKTSDCKSISESSQLTLQFEYLKNKYSNKFEVYSIIDFVHGIKKHVFVVESLCTLTVF